MTAVPAERSLSCSVESVAQVREQLLVHAEWRVVEEASTMALSYLPVEP